MKQMIPSPSALRLSRGWGGGTPLSLGSVQASARRLVPLHSVRFGAPPPTRVVGSRLEARVRPSGLTRSEHYAWTLHLFPPVDHELLATTRPPTDGAARPPSQLLLLRCRRMRPRGGPLPPLAATANGTHAPRHHRLNRGTPSPRPGQRRAPVPPAQKRSRRAAKLKPVGSRRGLGSTPPL